MTNLESINKATIALEDTAMSDDLEAGRERALQHLNAVPIEELEEKRVEMWAYRNSVGERKQEAMSEGDEHGAAYHSGQMSGLIHATEVFGELIEEHENE